MPLQSFTLYTPKSLYSPAVIVKLQALTFPRLCALSAFTSARRLAPGCGQEKVCRVLGFLGEATKSAARGPDGES